MNDSILMIVITLFTQIIVFLACTFSPYISLRGVFFGVRLDPQYKKDETIRHIIKSYLFKCTISFILLLIITLWYMINSNNENQVAFAMILSIFVLIGLCFVFFVMAHNQIKVFAHTLKTPSNQTTKTVIDTDFMKEKNKLRKYFRKLYLIPLILIVVSMVYSFLNYSSLPEMLPTHWNLLGEADDWQIKSPITLMIQSLIQLLLCGLLYYVSDQIFTTRGKLDTDSYETSKRVLMRYLQGMGYSLYIITLSIILIFTLTTFSMVKGTSLGVGFIVLGLILPLLGSVYMFITWFRYRKNMASNTNYSPEDEERHWIWGSFYYNPNDPSVFIEKRYGIGWTINLGTLTGKIIMIITLLFIIASIFLPLILS